MPFVTFIDLSPSETEAETKPLPAQMLTPGQWVCY